MNEITVYLGEEDAKRFIEFNKYYDIFNLMLEKKVFDQKGATITLNFDKFGKLRNIGRADFLYVYGVDFDNTN